jgi:tRNA dimethylallyltransferase
MESAPATPPAPPRAAAPHHLLDLVDPDEPFTLADYLEQARAAVTAIAERGRLPIVAGGTGLYVRALVQGFDVPRVPPNPALRAALDELAAQGGTAALLERLRRADPGAATTVDARNPRRLIRAIEVAETTGRPVAAQQTAHVPYDALLLGLTGPTALLYERADRRVDAMMAQGFLDEVAGLYARGYGPELPALSSLGYRELGEHLDGSRTLADAVQATKYATHRFIRRQLTWFRREPGIRWLDVAAGDPVAPALDAVDHWAGAQPARRAG